MTQSNPSFNLWTEPWITVERPGERLEVLNIPQTLTEAHEIHALYESSPLEVVSIHRLLVAILQDSLRLERVPDLVKIWRTGSFAGEALQTFAEKYAHRFDLFSAEAPFLQSADLSLQPSKEDNVKPAGYLLSEQPAGTAVTHYTHAYDGNQHFCSRCAAKGLLTIPAFASSGGAGIKPSINGVPPIYVLPGGRTLFDSLAASLTTPPNFQPGDPEVDTPWWKHKPIVPKKAVVKRVGYLHSLTFPARRVRLHPQPGAAPCTRCGQRTAWHVATMVYEMGESQPKEAPWWRDPFAAYRKPKNEKEAQNPLPIRPVEGRAVWREFAGLFLPTQPDNDKLRAYRPAILEQLEVLREALPRPDQPIPLRVISLRTDMKMKIFEWQESGFQITPRLLTDRNSAQNIERGLEFAAKCDGIIKGAFRDYFGGEGKDKRFEATTTHMSRRYWQELGQKFQRHIRGYTAEADSEQLFQAWLKEVADTAVEVFREAAETIPTTGYSRKPSALKNYKEVRRQAISKVRLQQEAINECRFRVYGYRKKHYLQEETHEPTETSRVD